MFNKNLELVHNFWLLTNNYSSQKSVVWVFHFSRKLFKLLSTGLSQTRKVCFETAHNFDQLIHFLLCLGVQLFSPFFHLGSQFFQTYLSYFLVCQVCLFHDVLIFGKTVVNLAGYIIFLHLLIFEQKDFRVIFKYPIFFILFRLGGRQNYWLSTFSQLLHEIWHKQFLSWNWPVL